MCNDINWSHNKNENGCRPNAIRVASFAKAFKPGRWSFLGRENEEMLYGNLIEQPLGKWNSTAEIMMQEFAESGHPGVLVLVSIVNKRRAQVREVDDLRSITPQTQVPRRCC